MMLVGILIGLNSVGIQLTSITIGVGVLGVGLAFGLQNITSNFISGIILLFERHVNVGDYITVDNIVGKVIAINIRSTTVVTPDNTALIVPNSKFIEGIVTNWSVIDPKIRILIPVRIGFKSDIDLISSILLQSAKEHKDALTDPEPAVFFRGYGEYGINMELSVWIAQPDPKIRSKIVSEINYHVYKLLRENNIDIPFQQFNLY
jgi:small-conductance mechanosensitive channel